MIFTLALVGVGVAVGVAVGWIACSAWMPFEQVAALYEVAALQRQYDERSEDVESCRVAFARLQAEYTLLERKLVEHVEYARKCGGQS